MISGFPNTYTFTKNLAERYIEKYHGDLKTIIFRPAIIAGGKAQPFPGWTDTLSAAGGLTFVGSLGLIHRVNMGGHNRFDIIPVDYVTNGLIVTTADAVSSGENLTIYNCGTSDANPVTPSVYV